MAKPGKSRPRKTVDDGKDKLDACDSERADWDGTWPALRASMVVFLFSMGIYIPTMYPSLPGTYVAFMQHIARSDHRFDQNR